VRRAVVLGLWLGGTLVLGLLAVLPLGFGVTAAARLSGGPDGAHHATTTLLGVDSPFPVDSDEIAVSLVFGILGLGILVGPLTWLLILLRRTLPPGAKATALTLTATLALALSPSACVWTTVH